MELSLPITKPPLVLILGLKLLNGALIVLLGFNFGIYQVLFWFFGFLVFWFFGDGGDGGDGGDRRKR